MRIETYGGLVLAALIGCKAGGTPQLGTLSPAPSGSSSAMSSSAMSSSAMSAVAVSQSPSAPALPTASPSGPFSKGANGWMWRGPDPGFSQSFYNGPIGIDAGGGICRFVYDKDNRKTTIECFDKGSPKRRWGRDEYDSFTEDAALLADEQNLYVARFSDIATGCQLIAYHLQGGDEAWRTPLMGLGPISHSEYLNKVEIAFGAAGKIQVFGWESGGRYIEEVDAASGHTLASRRLDGPGAPLDVPPPAPRLINEPPHPGESEKAQFAFGSKRPEMRVAKSTSVNLKGGGHCSYSFSDNDQVSLACFEAKAKRTWGFDLARQFVAAGEIATFDKSIIVVSYCAISDGATVTAYDSATGRELWQTSLFGIGPVAHSKYSNVVDLHMAQDKVVISGWESSGKYIEVLDAVSGRALGNRQVP